MDSVRLTDTDIETSQIGFGCAGLFHAAERSQRRAVLERALEIGIRHFDVAPMYGFGLAEAELGAVIRTQRREVTITTKYGIAPSAAGRVVGLMQGPVRSVLARRPQLGASLKASGRSPTAGLAGRVLYRSDGYDAVAASRSLTGSLRTLRTDYVDVFLLHDPPSSLSARFDDVAAGLERERDKGRIRCWGVTAESATSPLARDLSRQLPLLQCRDDLFDTSTNRAQARGAALITFGSLGRALPQLRRHLDANPDLAMRLSDRLGFDLHRGSALAGLLLRQGVRRNPDGIVLFSTSRRERVAAASTEQRSDTESAVVRDLAALSGRSGPDGG